MSHTRGIRRRIASLLRLLRLHALALLAVRHLPRRLRLLPLLPVGHLTLLRRHALGLALHLIVDRRGPGVERRVQAVLHTSSAVVKVGLHVLLHVLLRVLLHVLLHVGMVGHGHAALHVHPVHVAVRAHAVGNGPVNGSEGGAALRRVSHDHGGVHARDLLPLGDVWQVRGRPLLPGLHALEAEGRVLLRLVLQMPHLALEDRALLLLLAALLL
mmetsp:Transcript_68198/g.168517  ORF Transcript_68198/g.168517 Transcript_68198/m.168517 type:complete len:214 (+) Transcript_68198:655-1296(+)